MTAAGVNGAAKPRKVRLVPPGGEPPSDRTVVKLGPELHENIAAAAGGLSKDPELYHRGGALVRVVRSSESEGPSILPHGVASLRARLSRFCWFQKWDRDAADWLPCLPSDPVTKAIHESPETWTRIRPLAGVPEYPVLLASGDVLLTPGYEPTSELLFQPRIDFGAIPAEPTPDQSAEALRYLWVETSHDFPFRGMGYATPDPRDPDGVFRYTAARDRPDAWGVVAAIMSLLGRPAIDGDMPAIVFDATTPGSGKGLQADLVSTIVFGRVIGKLTYPSTGGLDADHVLEQMLGGEARCGSLLVILDEVKQPMTFGGSAINKVLTGGGRTRFRPLGVTETDELPWRALLLATGNNITVADNTHRRTLVPRLEPPMEDPTKYRGKRRHARLLAWAREHRAALVRAALTVLRGYIVAGRPSVGIEEWSGGFESWSCLVARAIRWAGGGDVMGCRPSADPDARNEEAIRMEIILDAIAKLAPPEGITIGRFLDALYTPDRLRGRNADGSPLVDDGYSEARDAINAAAGARGGRRPDSVALGNFFRNWKGRPIGARQLQPLGTTHNAQRWGVATAGA